MDSNPESSEERPIQLGNLFANYINSDQEIYNSRGQQLLKSNLPAADTLEEDRICIGGKCLYYRVYFKDNFTYARAIPTKEVFDSMDWTLRQATEYDRSHIPKYFNYKGELIPEPTSCTKLKEADIPWFEKVYDKHGRCMGFRIYSLDGGISLCTFNDYILEKEAYRRYKADMKRQKKQEEMAAKMPHSIRDPKTGKFHWVDKETGEILD